MARTTNLSRPIVEALYAEALVLADEVRAVFTAGTREPPVGEDAYIRLALSTEGLIPTCIDHDPRAHWRRPMVMMRHG
jgi:regulator of CtrA degradation